MFLSEPGQTNYDINFNLFGFPIRVHPAFFVMPLVLGSGFLRFSPLNAGITLLLLTAVFFLSILVHELGHAFAFRYYGQPSRIVLYWMGGLAIPDLGHNPWSVPGRSSLTPQQQIVVSLAGPVFGFLLAAVLVGVVLGIGGSVEVATGALFPVLVPDLPFQVTDATRIFLGVGLWANIFWNLLNLVPVFPLDGGQVARQIFVLNDAWNGIRYSVYLSVAVGAIVAFASFSTGDRFIGFFFAFMAWSNYMSLQQFGGGGFGGGPWR